MLHQVILEVPPNPKATCEHCERVFKSKGVTQSHQYNSFQCRPLHMKDKPVTHVSTVCEQCGVKFFNKYTLKKHINEVHEKNFDLKCEKCPTGNR